MCHAKHHNPMNDSAKRDLLIDNARLVDPSQDLDLSARILIVDGCISRINPTDGEVPATCERLDAMGRIVAPGLVDLGAELREPGSEEDETIESGSHAALAGGFTSVLCCSTDVL